MRRLTLLFAILLVAAPLAAQWPLEPTAGDHPVGNTFGEYQWWGDFFHAGIDILATPQLNADGTVNAAAPWSRATHAGVVNSFANGNTTYNFAYVEPGGGPVYLYGHLQMDSYDPDFVTNFNNGTPIAANDEIAKIVRWSCDYHHHHYEIQQGGTTLLSPYPIIGAANPDTELPVIDDITFAQDNSDPWVVLAPAAAGACAPVTGLVDVVAKIKDRDAAGSALAGASTNWVRNIRWRACADGAACGAWIGTHVYDDMPFTWWSTNAPARAAYSTRAPWVSSADYCADGWQYGIVTNFAAGLADTAGRWDTTAVANGAYTVNVEATDFAGNTTVRNRRACVQNGGGCTTELMIRDWTDDLGGIPYPGPFWWVSPDITANPGTAIEDVNINVGALNPINVTVRNSGTCTLASGAQYTVCLGWGPPSGSIAHPLPAAQLIGCQTVTVGAGGFVPGGSSTTTINWTPDAMTVPLGHHCLVAWVDHMSDPVLNTPAVNYDDNRAQQNIEFVMPPGQPGAPQSGSFWVNPQKMIDRRSIELTFHSKGDPEIRIYIPPGLNVGRTIGGDLAATTPNEKPLYEPTRLVACDAGCATADDAARKGCARVIRGVDSRGRLRLDGISVAEAQQIIVEVRGGGATRVDVVEYGVIEGMKEVVPVGGVTIQFQEARRQ
jgi:hypothetical protein